jgi:sugar lactone lactonase YvrE
MTRTLLTGLLIGESPRWHEGRLWFSNWGRRSSRWIVWAELGQGGDGICIDAEGAIWSSVTIDGRPTCARVREGGEVLQRIDLDQGCFARMLGGEDGRTLFMLTADWRGTEHFAELLQARTGELVTAPAPVPGAGRP